MTDEMKRLLRESEEHAEKAKRLLRLSKEIHDTEREGLIKEQEAIGVCVPLNTRAVEEMEKAIELRKAFMKEQDRENGRGV